MKPRHSGGPSKAAYGCRLEKLTFVPDLEPLAAPFIPLQESMPAPATQLLSTVLCSWDPRLGMRQSDPCVCGGGWGRGVVRGAGRRGSQGAGSQDQASELSPPGELGTAVHPGEG